jgi:FeS assembly SUF system protein
MNASGQGVFSAPTSTGLTRGPDYESSLDNAPPALGEIIAALRTVFDPEIPVSVYDLGLIYRIEPSDAGAVEIDMTLTAPGCPVAGTMLEMVKTAVSSVVGVRECTVNLVFDPPWDKSRMSEETQLELGLL